MFRLPRAFGLLALLLSLTQVGCLDKSSEHRIRANAFMRGGDPQGAVTECDLGLALKKDDPALLILKAKALFELEHLDESKVAYARVLEVAEHKDTRGLIESHVGLGMIASRQGDWKEARTQFEAIVKLDGTSASAQLNLARACLSLKDVECAVTHAKTADELSGGKDEATLYTLGTVYLQADKPADAERVFQHICDMVPGAATCPYGLAMVAAKSGDKARALAKLKEAIERKVPDPARIANEAYFASIKDDPEFVAMVAKAAEK